MKQNYFRSLVESWEQNPELQSFPENLPVDKHGLAAMGGTLSPPLLLEAIWKGYFPWTGEEPIPWYSPDPRLILEPRSFQVHTSFQKFLNKHDYQIRFDHNFREVMRHCANTARRGQDGTWITKNMFEVNQELFELHIAHCVSVHRRDGTIVGGLYGFTMGKAFFGESMFHTEANCSKLALFALCQRLKEWDFDFVDCQQDTPHLRSLGARTVSREKYLSLLKKSRSQKSVHFSWSRVSGTDQS